MAEFNRSIFRERAIRKYAQNQELNVILRLVSPPVFVSLGILLLLFMAAGVLVASMHVPVTVTGNAVVIEQKVNTEQTIVVLLFLPADQRAHLQTGQTVSVSVGSTGTTFTSAIDHIEANVMSPAAIRTLFNLQGATAQAISGPAAVATAPVVPASQAKTDLGSLCTVNIQIGSQSVFSLLPDFDTLLKI